MLGLLSLLKNRVWHRCFTVNFAKLLRTHFLQNTYWRVLLKQEKKKKKLFEALTPVLIKTLRLTEIWVYVCKYRLFSVKTFTHLKLFKKIHRKNLSQNLFFNGYVGQEPMQSLRNIFSRYNKF